MSRATKYAAIERAASFGKKTEEEAETRAMENMYTDLGQLAFNGIRGLFTWMSAMSDGGVGVSNLNATRDFSFVKTLSDEMSAVISDVKAGQDLVLERLAVLESAGSNAKLSDLETEIEHLKRGLLRLEKFVAELRPSPSSPSPSMVGIPMPLVTSARVTREQARERLFQAYHDLIMQGKKRVKGLDVCEMAGLKYAHFSYAFGNLKQFKEEYEAWLNTQSAS
jgi:hypothetical protein